MAKMNDLWVSTAFKDNVYISKRSIRKSLISKRHYLPVESNITDTMKTSFNLPSEEGISASANCDESKNKRIQENPRSQATCHLHERYSEQSSEKERGVDVTHVKAEPGSDPEPGSDSRLNHEHLEATSITNMKVKQEVEITTPYDLAAIPQDQQEIVGDECEVEGNRADSLNSSQIQVLKRHFGDTENRPYKCPYCNWAFKRSSNLFSHIDTHQGLKPHVCDLCGKAYSHQGTLQQHKRLHTGERPYQCPFCEKSYIWSSDFRKHIRTHTGEKPYTCEECGKDFVRSSDLRKHERNMHTNNKPFLCKQCGQTFNKPLSLLRHERKHLGERPFVCPECGKAFALASRMTEHRKIHSSVRPYTCSVCSKAFTKSSNLAEHLTVHSGVRPHNHADAETLNKLVTHF
uniref:Zinc finger protein 648 n=1 Tax=Cyprinus carpio TaxID=7962 RepID=A0A8C2DN53_CYPCA